MHVLVQVVMLDGNIILSLWICKSYIVAEINGLHQLFYPTEKVHKVAICSANDLYFICY